MGHHNEIPLPVAITLLFVVLAITATLLTPILLRQPTPYPTITGIVEEAELIEAEEYRTWIIHFDDGRQILLKENKSIVFHIGRKQKITYRKGDAIIKKVETLEEPTVLEQPIPLE